MRRNLGWSTTLGLGFSLISYTVLRKMLATRVSMTFPDFQRQVEWCQSYFTKLPLKAYK